MLSKSTVFVLGAGASVPYGFPTGAELRRTLCTSDERSFLAYRLRDLCGIDPSEMGAFAAAFLKSGLSSIDSFLARRPDLQRIGKLALAAVLSNLERPQKIIRADNDDDWYGMLWNKVVDDVSSANQLTFAGIRIVTFNYDRSFHYYMLEAIRNSFGIDEEQAFNILIKIPVIHVYGNLGALIYSSQTTNRPFKEEWDGRDIERAADQIRIMPEARLDDAGFTQVRQWFSTADQICFLGFGFDPLNVKRLGLKEVLETARTRAGSLIPVYATVLGMTKSEIRSIEAAITEHGNIRVFELKNLDALRNCPVLY